MKRNGKLIHVQLGYNTNTSSATTAAEMVASGTEDVGTFMKKIRAEKNTEKCIALQRLGLALLSSPRARRGFVPENMSRALNIVSNRKRTQQFGPFLDHIQYRGSEVVDEMNVQDVSLCLNALSKLRVTNTEFLSKLQFRGVEVADVMTAQDVSNCLSALSKMRDSNADFLSELQVRGVEVDHTMNAQNVSDCLNALSKLRDPNSEFVSKLQCRGVEVTYTMTAQGVRMCLHALRKLKITNSECIDRLQRRGISR